MAQYLICFVMVVFGLTCQPLYALQETLPPLKNGIAPQTFEALWAGYDPRAEPLEVEVLEEWEEDGVMLSIVRYRIGIFKGQKAMMAAVYGYPKGGKNLPGLVQIHGGGQYAHSNAVFTNAKRGYATISIAWAGRIDAPGYKVTPDIVRLFWDGKTDDPKYKLTTDWGALDAYHAPCRNPKNAFAHVRPQPWTLDDIDSPRNNPWFLVTVGARRALTFLEQQSQVDAERLGVYGHSMGGKLTVLTTAADARVKASAPSCGGLSDRASGNALYDATIADDVSLNRIACPIMFLSPSNDFHGRINDLQKALKEIESKDWRVTCSPHHNHQDTPEYEVATQLWFDQILKGTFTWPEIPESSLELKTTGRVPSFSVTPDASRPIVSVDVYYTQQGQTEGEKHDRINTMNRFWRHVHAKPNGRTWTADLPLLGLDKPLWAYANVLYQLDNPVTGAGYYYGTYTTDQFNLSSPMHRATAEQLHTAHVQATLEPSLMIETFEGDWEKEWFSYKPADLQRKTHKLYDPQWAAPAGARLAIGVLSEGANTLVVGMDAYAAEVQLKGDSTWQKVVLSLADFRNVAGETLPDWLGIKELRLGDRDQLRGQNRGQRLTLGAHWQGEAPQFRNLCWITSDRLESQSKPNIILIMCDDMGWSDIGCYGGEVATPTLDKMASEGVRFSQFYNNAKCTTSRASLVTGLYPRHGGKGQNLLDEHVVTFGEVLREADYQTALVGKWHLGSKSPHRPYDRGFDEFYGLMDGCCNFFDPARPDPKFKGGRVRVFGHNDELITKFPDDFYTTDAFTDHAIRTITRFAKNDSPFFLHLTYTAPHYPLHAKPKDIEKYRGKFTMGWDRMREQRYQRQVNMGLIDPKTYPLSQGDPKLYDWEASNKVWEDLRMAVYAAMIDAMDQNIGRLMGTLKDLGIDEDTVVMFLSDNGGCSEEPGGSDLQRNPVEDLGGVSTYMTVGPAWGWAQNAPFKRYKANTHEGGIRTPMIARWPGKIKANSIERQPGHIIDFMATFIDMAAAQYPKAYKGSEIIPLEGKSLLPVFLGKTREPHRDLIWHWAGNRAIRAGEWKAVWEKKTRKWKLYDLAVDQTETRDLAGERPELAQTLAARWRGWADMTGVTY